MAQVIVSDELPAADIQVSGPVPGEVARLVSLLGVDVVDVTRATACEMISRLIQVGDGRCRCVYFVNAHTLNVATDDPAYRDVLNAADVVFNDGTGARWAARQRGVELRDNLCGTDLIPQFLGATDGRGYRYFLLGSSRDTIRDAAVVARQQFPGWTLAGFHHGYVQGEKSRAVVEQINAAHVDLLLVGMGNPWQERWIHTHQSALHVPLAIGVGGLFDHWVGKPRRAPVWVRRAGCEWVHKLLLQPHKWRRYLLGNPTFLLRMTRTLHADRARMAGRAVSIPRELRRWSSDRIQ